MQTCPSCMLTFDPLQGGYSPNGAIVCARCAAAFSHQQKAREEARLASPFIGACGSLVIALASFFLQLRILVLPVPVLMPLLAIAAGVGTAFPAYSNPEVKGALGKKRLPTVALGTAGALLGLLSLIISITADEKVEDSPVFHSGQRHQP